MTEEDPRHRRLRESLGAFALGHLDPGEVTALRAHLDGCPACRAELAEILTVVPALSALDASAVASPATPPSWLGEAIVDAVSAERVLRDRRRGRDRVRHGALTAAAAVTAVIVIGGAGLVIGERTAEMRPVAQPTPSTSAVVPMEPVTLTAAVPGITVSAAVLIPHTWGVELRFSAAGLEAGQTYRAAFRSHDGVMRPAGEFIGVGSKSLKCNMQAALLRTDTAGFVVYDAAGTPVLEAALPVV